MRHVPVKAPEARQPVVEADAQSLVLPALADSRAYGVTDRGAACGRALVALTASATGKYGTPDAPGREPKRGSHCIDRLAGKVEEARKNAQQDRSGCRRGHG